MKLAILSLLAALGACEIQIPAQPASGDQSAAPSSGAEAKAQPEIAAPATPAACKLPVGIDYDTRIFQDPTTLERLAVVQVTDQSLVADTEAALDAQFAHPTDAFPCLVDGAGPYNCTGPNWVIQFHSLEDQQAFFDACTPKENE